MFIEPAQAVEAAVTLWDNRSAIASAARRIWRWVRKGRLRVAIFGPGGMGKTTLGHFLSGALDPYQGPTGYSESIGVEDFKLKGDVPCTLVVAPGQEFRRAQSWTAMLADLVKGKAHGVINVVSYGHESPSVPWKQHRCHTAGMTVKQFLPALTASARDEELKVVQTLAHQLKLTSKLWMITLVTKQDLWWRQRHAVRKHYETGPYHDAIKAIIGQVGAANFRHEYLSASLSSTNLVDSEGTLLCPVAEGYDDSIQTAHLRRLLDTIVEMVK